MKGSLLIYLLQFFSGIIILAIILMSSTIISYHIFQKNQINSKLQAEVLSSIISSLSSSTLDYNVTIRVGDNCNITIYDNKVSSRIGNDEYTMNLIIPNYIQIQSSEAYCTNDFLYVYKNGDKIWLE